MAPSDRKVAGLVGGRYEIASLIASGGMGSVYRAYDTVLQRPVALKVLREGVDASLVARLRTEAQNAARLSHPSIVHVYDFGYADDAPYIAMELVEGQTLREVLAERKVLPPDVAAQIAIQVASALEQARRAGIVHRDVKPENILLTAEGRVKVADFGLSRAFAASTASGGPLVGTAHYLAPEQVRGEPIDHRADLYALGIVLYEMVTGRAPFSGDSTAAVALQRLQHDVPSPMATNPSVPRALDAVVARATARDPAERFQTAGEMLEALRAADVSADTADLGALVHHTTVITLDAEPTVVIARAPKRMKRRRRRVALLVVAIATTLVAAIAVPPRFARTEVPAVTGKTQQEAKEILEGLGFRVDAVLRNDPQVPSGSVIAQDPEPPAMLREGATVQLTVSIGPELISPPEVINQPFDEVEIVLRDKGFVVERVDVFHPSIPRLHVVSQSIQPGVLVEKGSTMTLRVSKGPEQIAVPDVVGDTEASARADLAAKGFEIVVKRQQHASVEAGAVISQTPKPGTRAEKGATVTIVVSTGPPQVTVPNLRCMTKRQAEDALAHAGFKARFEDSGARVVDQQPGPSEKAAKGSTVTVYMGFGSFC